MPVGEPATDGLPRPGRVILAAEPMRRRLHRDGPPGRHQRRAIRGAWAVLVAASALGATPGAAQEPPEPAPAEGLPDPAGEASLESSETIAEGAEAPMSDPSTAFRRGVELMREGDFDAAAAAFRDSYRLQPRVATMCNLALAYDRAGPRWRARAVRAYRSCARDDETGRFRDYAEHRSAALERAMALAEDEPTAEPESVPDPEGMPDVPEVAMEPGPPLARYGLLPASGTDSPVGGTDGEGGAGDAARAALLWAGVGTAVLSAGALTAGVVLALDAQDTLADLRDDLGPNGTIVRGSAEHARLEDAQRSADASSVLYVVAGVLGAGAATLLTLTVLSSGGDREGEREPPVLVLSPAGTGVVASGRF